MSSEAQNPWFKRRDKGIVTPTTQKKESPDGFWYKTPTGDVIAVSYTHLTLPTIRSV